MDGCKRWFNKRRAWDRVHETIGDALQQIAGIDRNNAPLEKIVRSEWNFESVQSDSAALKILLYCRFAINQ